MGAPARRAGPRALLAARLTGKEALENPPWGASISGGALSGDAVDAAAASSVDLTSPADSTTPASDATGALVTTGRS